MILFGGLAAAALAAFVGLDAFLARHYLPRVASGYAAAAAVIEAAPRLLVGVLFGSRYVQAVPALRILALSAFATGIVTVGLRPAGSAQLSGRGRRRGAGPSPARAAF